MGKAAVGTKEIVSHVTCCASIEHSMPCSVQLKDRAATQQQHTLQVPSPHAGLDAGHAQVLSQPLLGQRACRWKEKWLIAVQVGDSTCKQYRLASKQKPQKC